jgi:hypothetical protein
MSKYGIIAKLFDELFVGFYASFLALPANEENALVVGKDNESNEGKNRDSEKNGEEQQRQKEL